MCMISSIANINDNSAENKARLQDVIRLMFKGMSEVNKDGTGIALSTQEGQLLLYKTAKSGTEVAAAFQLDQELDYKHVIMHTRMATFGAVTDENAHPHESQFGYMVHNGWCSELYNKNKNNMKTGCDSEALSFSFNPDLDLFNANLDGREHFAFAHLSNDGNSVIVANKNKSLYRAYSRVLSAELVLTSPSVLSDVGKFLNEALDIKPVHGNDVINFDGYKTKHSTFKFIDKGHFSHFAYEWEGDHSDLPWYNRGRANNNNMAHWKDHDRPSSSRSRNNTDIVPKHIKKLSRKERKAWIKENARKRAEYMEFWSGQLEAEDERFLEGNTEEDLKDNGFQILDYFGGAVDD